MSETLTISQFKSLPKKKRSKYGNKRSGKFDSEKERNRYATLKLMERAGEVRNIQHHKIYSLDVNGVHICNYESDFVYEKATLRYDDIIAAWVEVVEDVKSEATKTPLYKLKKKLMKAIYNITIVEV